MDDFTLKPALLLIWYGKRKKSLRKRKKKPRKRDMRPRKGNTDDRKRKSGSLSLFFSPLLSPSQCSPLTFNLVPTINVRQLWSSKMVDMWGSLRSRSRRKRRWWLCTGRADRTLATSTWSWWDWKLSKKNTSNWSVWTRKKMLAGNHHTVIIITTHGNRIVSTMVMIDIVTILGRGSLLEGDRRKVEFLWELQSHPQAKVRSWSFQITFEFLQC